MAARRVFLTSGGPALPTPPARSHPRMSSPLPLSAPVEPGRLPATGEFCDAFGRRCYRIAHAESLPPFLINLVSASDLWMFVASNGALTAGRGDADGALFPYQTADRIYDSAGIIGPVTALGVATAAGEVLWEPFAPRPHRGHEITRNLYKSVEGDCLWFEEFNRGLGLVFRYGWATADTYGFVRRSELENLAGWPVRVRVLDGLRNLLPAGVSQRLQGMSSNLADAYKTAELLPGSTLAVYALAAGIVDRPQPVEALRAGIVWSGGLPGAAILLSDVQLETFFAGGTPHPEAQRRGRRGAYLLSTGLTLAPRQTERWFLVADTGLGQPEVAARRLQLAAGEAQAGLAAAEAAATRRLRALIGAADGIQAGGDETAAAHHFANVLFNVLRGGTFADGHRIPGRDFAAFVAGHNRAVAVRHAAWLRALPESLPRAELLARAATLGDADLARLAGEYLPLMFSRRHGDPSRPWNRFSIRLQDAQGRRLLAYEGNWRDIFQNWEALCLSYPEFFDAVVAKFLNASTADGFNPYRISQAGIDWEAPDPEDPWSSIGYWGDHQVVYLLKLLEWASRHQPAALPAALRTPRYSYANVPYRLAGYEALRRDPRATITFDAALHRAIRDRLPETGADARLAPAPGGGVLHVSLAEKLLVLVLVRLTHFIPGGGIWMNTQRPEWNDANNALVGYGVSVVTLCYLRRLLAHARAALLPALGATPVAVSAAVAALARAVTATLAAHAGALARPDFDAASRRALVDELAQAGAEYRACVYAGGPGPATGVEPALLTELFAHAQAFADHSIRANRRDDGLVHAYNRLEFTENSPGLALHRLPLMLEGQVAALSAGMLTPPEAVALLEALRCSPLHRADQHSYILYPDRDLPGFMERNRIPPAAWNACPWFDALQAAGDRRLAVRDAAGTGRFHADLVNGEALERMLAGLRADPCWAEAAAAHSGRVREIYEEVFRHRAFTGRSGSMFGFEGLGSIYWHMVAKLLLAVQENLFAAQAAGAPEAARLAGLYHDVRAGLGFNKTPAEYGAFPTDPYSHTPAHAGAQQPGMTGQVKEEILTRFGELGVQVAGGRLAFRPTLLRAGEFTATPAAFRHVRADGTEAVRPMPARALGFTCCGTPVIYRRDGGPARLRLLAPDGSIRELAGVELDAVASAAVFSRAGSIAAIEVELGDGYRPLPSSRYPVEPAADQRA